MKLSSVVRFLIMLIIIIIIIGGVVIIIIIRGPIPDPPRSINTIKLLGIAQVVLGLVSLGLLSRIQNADRR